MIVGLDFYGFPKPVKKTESKFNELELYRWCFMLQYSHAHIEVSFSYTHIVSTCFTIWLFNIAMENDPFIDDFPIKTSISGSFSMAMLVITRG